MQVTKIATEAYSGTIPGGWFSAVNSYGTVVQSAHESAIYTSNDTVENVYPISERLTGITNDRSMHIVVDSQDKVLTDSGTMVYPAALLSASVVASAAD